jgi:hypothetical protein
MENPIQQLDVSALPIAAYDRLCELTGIDPDLREWRALAGMDDKIFNVLIRQAFVRYAESAQLAPASEAHHHCGPGGLLLHTHDVVTLALKRRRALQLPLGGSISEINEKRHLWTYGIFAACLLHDIGKLASTIRIILNLRNGQKRPWNPHDEPITAFPEAVSYSIRFQKLPYAYHHQIAPTFFDILPRVARSWIANDVTLMKQLCAHLRGDRYESGVIGEIAEAADMTSTARNLQLPMPKQRFSAAVPVIDRFIGAIRAWIKEGEVKINVNGGMGWVDEAGACYFVCRSLAEKLIRYCDDLGITDIPRDPIRIYDILQEHGYALPTPDDKAVWTIEVSGQTSAGESYQHKFTCLKFEARRLVVPTRMLEPVRGIVEVIEAAEKSAVKPTKPNLSSVATEPPEAAMPEQENAAETATERQATAHLDADSAEQESASSQQYDIANSRDNAAGAPKEAARKSLIFGTVRKELENRSGGPARDLHCSQEPAAAAGEHQEAENHGAHSNVAAGAAKAESQSPEPADTVEEHQASEDAEGKVRDRVEDDTRECAGVQRVQELIGKSKATAESASDDQEAGGARKTLPGKKPWEMGEAVVTSLPMYQGITIQTENIGRMFFNWLKKGLVERTILINTPVALVHIVEDGVLLLSPGLFKDFCLKHGMPETDHKPLSRKFDKLKLCTKNEQGLFIHTLWAVGNTRAGKVSGRLIPHHQIYGDGYPIPQINKFFKKSLTPQEV